MSPHQAEVERLLAEYRRSRDVLAAMHRSLSALRVIESTPDGSVTVAVGATGTLVDLSIDPQAYRRYRPQRLAQTILDLASVAARRVGEQAARLVEPVLPAGADPSALLGGTADLRTDQIAPAASAATVADDDQPESWLEHAHGGEHR